MMRRTIWSIGLIMSALLASLFTPASAQNERCCDFQVRHNFRVCLPRGCQIPQVRWDWFTQAMVWPPLQTNTNSGSNLYPVPSADTQCASAVAPQDCAFANACARFSVAPIPGTNCIQGFHEAFGRACVRCRGFGARASAASRITILCRAPNAAGQIVWQPAFRDTVRAGCGVQNTDPVVLKLRNSATGETRNDVLFDLRASRFSWEGQDVDGDGWYDTARIRYCCMDVDGDGYLAIQVGGESLRASAGELRLRTRNNIVTEAFKNGLFDSVRLPNVGEQVPPEIPLPFAEFDLTFQVPDGWVLEEVEMGGGGESGDTPPPPGDVNGDGCVDDADLLAVLFAFGGSGGPEDVNGDGVVDDADLLIVLFNFGQGC